MNWVVDLLNGELFFKLEMDSLQNKPSKKTLGVLQDMQQFANKTDSFQLLNLKSYQTDLTQLNTVKR